MYLPSPPDNKEKRLYLEPNKVVLYSFGIISYLSLLSGMLLFSKNHIWFIPFVILTGFYLGVSYFIGIFGSKFDYLAHRLIRWKHRSYRPTVDVYLPVCGEDTNVILNTWRYVQLLDYPKELLNIYVLNDGNDQANNDRLELQAKYRDFHYIERPNKGELKKAGNMRYAFPLSDGELILILDADFCPRPDFLLEIIPHFAEDDKVAIVQTPQFFKIDSEHSWVEKGAAYVQELFYRLIQVNRNTWGAAICVGTCAVYRRKALEPFGGTAAIGYSEDLHTGWNCLISGWKVKYFPINLAKGVCPDKLSAYFNQQYRWCMGSTTLFTNPEFWKAKLPIMIKLNYMSGMFYYISTGLGIFITPIPSLTVVWFFPEHIIWYNWLFSIPSTIFGIWYMSVWSKAPFGTYVIQARVASYYAHFFAIKDKIMSSTMPWVPTGVVKRNKQFLDMKGILFYWNTLYLALGIAGCFYRMNSLTDYNFYPMIAFTLFNYWCHMSILKEEA